MARTHHILFQLFTAWSLLAQPKKEPADYVNPHIGAVGLLLTGTSPSIGLPYALVRLAPITSGGPDRYLANKISGFPAAGVILMPTTGPLETDPAKYASEFDRDFETATPYYGSNVLDKYAITVDYTVTRRAAFYRFAYPGNSSAHLLMMAGQGGEIATVGPDSVAGFSGGGGTRNYFFAIF